MSEKISEYITSVTALASGDLMDVSKLISTSPLEYQSQKLNYSVLLTELQTDMTFSYANITPMTSSQLASIISDETGTGALVFATSPTLVTPSLGVATATSINGNIFSGATNSTWNLSNNKTFSVSNTISFTGTDGTSFIFPSGNGTIARLSDIPAASNLGNTNLTSTDDARTFTLKSGTTASQNFQILNSASQIGYYFDGTGSVAIGTTTTAGKLTIKGSGSTSATKTALFQNSSSLKSLEIFDSGGINFGSNTISGGEGYAFGVQNTVGSSTAFASGYLNIVNAYYAAAFGRENNITSYCFAAGYGNTISATLSFAFGSGNIVSGSHSLVTGSSNGASGLNSFVYGGNSAVTSNYSMSGGLYATATGNNSVAIGLGYAPQAHNQLIAGGTASFIFSAKNASSVPNTGAMANYSFILGGLNHSVVSGATSSGIIGGEGNTINASVLRSVILGGSAITATASDTVYTPNLNITADVIFAQSTNSTATGANARIASHPTSTIIMTNASLTSIGSIIAGTAGGHLLTIMNETGSSITIVDAYGSAAAGEIIYTNTALNLTIRNHCGATFQYNATGACWTKI